MKRDWGETRAKKDVGGCRCSFTRAEYVHVVTQHTAEGAGFTVLTEENDDSCPRGSGERLSRRSLFLCSAEVYHHTLEHRGCPAAKLQQAAQPSSTLNKNFFVQLHLAVA